MAQLEPYQKDIEAAGATLAFIAAEKREGFFKPVDYLGKHPISTLFLLDENRQVTKAYGVYHRIGFDAYNIARPATFVIATDSVVRWIHVGQSQYDRAPVEAILEAVRAIGD